MGRFQPGQALVGLPLPERQQRGLHGPLGVELARVGQQPLPGGQGQGGLAGAFGQLGQQLQGVGGGGVALQEGDGGLGFARPLLRGDEGVQQGAVAGAGLQGVAQGLGQGRIVEQARGQTQYGLPGSIAAGAAGQYQPVLQRLGLVARPFRGLRQALAPVHGLGPVLHGGAGQQPGVLQLAVFQEYLVAQEVGFLVERRQGGRGSLVGHGQPPGAQPPGAIVIHGAAHCFRSWLRR